MKRLLAFALLTATALTVFAWQLPASVVAALLPVEANRFLQIHRITGTIWRGNALVTTVGVAPSLSLSWQCQPTIAPLGASCTLSDSVTGIVKVGLFSSALSAEKLAATLPVQVNVANGAAMAGSPRVTLIVESATFSSTTMTVTGSARADAARYALGQSPIALGEVTADCKPDTSTVAATCAISNRGGAAKLDGQLSLFARKIGGTIELIAPGTPAQRMTFSAIAAFVTATAS